MSAMGDPAPPKKRRPRTPPKITALNAERRERSDALGAVAYDLKITHSLTLEQTRKALIARGYPDMDASTIHRAWRNYAARRPHERLHELRKIVYEKFVASERRLLQYLNVIDEDGNPVLPPLKTVLEVERQLSVIRQQLVHVMGLAAKPEETSSQYAGAHVTIHVAYPESMREEPALLGAGPAPEDEK
jgi:hypothetical protein